MNAHDLARLLLEGPDLPVITAREVDLEVIHGVAQYELTPHSEWRDGTDGQSHRHEPAVVLW